MLTITTIDNVIKDFFCYQFQTCWSTLMFVIFEIIEQSSNYSIIYWYGYLDLNFLWHYHIYQYTLKQFVTPLVINSIKSE